MIPDFRSAIAYFLTFICLIQGGAIYFLWSSTPDVHTTKEVVSDSSTTIKSDTTSPPDTTLSLFSGAFDDPIILRDTTVVDTSSNEGKSCKYSIRRYTRDFSDEYIEGSATIKTLGYLKNIDFQYTPIYPSVIETEIKTSVNRKITETKVIEQRPYLSVGVSGVTDFNTLKEGYVGLRFSVPREYSIGYSKSLFNKQHKVSIYTSLNSLFGL